jgi:PhzF family phenazine biosynthesis protein
MKTDIIRTINVAYYEAFSELPGKGNPAGVVLDADDLTEEEMQCIAKKVGFNETVFLSKSDKADFRLRYYTPSHEMNLCGHGTVASIIGLMEREKITNSKDIQIETLAGILQIHYDAERQEVRMEQAPAEFMRFQGDVDRLAASIGIIREDIDSSLPIVYGSTGIWTLILPIRSVATFLRMKPNNKVFQEILTQIPVASVHPICMETYDKTCRMHGRHFSATRSGTVEDPVTGTASGVMGAYYIEYVKPSNKADIIIEQGYEIGKNGLVRVFAKRVGTQIEVSIAGKAVYVRDMAIEL